MNQGYRVLVVEQTETPDQLDKRRKQEGSKDKVTKHLYLFLLRCHKHHNFVFMTFFTCLFRLLNVKYVQ